MKFFLFFLFMGFYGISYSQVDLENGLAAYYPFSGDAGDSSTMANHGVVNGATLSSDRFGNLNKAYEFDGVDDYIEIADASSLDISSAITVSLWVNHYSAQTWGARYIDKSTGGTGDGYCFDTNGGGCGTATGLGMRFINSQSNCASSTYPINEWHHLLVTFENGTTNFYLDGVLDGTSTGANTSLGLNNRALRIGASPYNTTPVVDIFFHGKMDEIRIYNRVLSASEISELAGIVSGVLSSKGSKVEFNVYPNPGINGKFNLEMENSFSQVVEITIVNSLGQEILPKMDIFKKSIQEEIDLSKNPKGIYYMTIKKGDSISSSKLIVN